jgi:hypothetical protein
METLTFDQLPGAVSVLLEKVSHLEELLLANEGNTKGVEQSIDVNQAAKFLNMAVAHFQRKQMQLNHNLTIISLPM